LFVCPLVDWWVAGWMEFPHHTASYNPVVDWIAVDGLVRREREKSILDFD